MRALLAGLFFWLATFFTTPTFAQQVQEYSFQPCDYWSYDFDVRGYICQFRGPTITVPEVGDLASTIAKLEAKITALETRIAELESTRE